MSFQKIYKLSTRDYSNNLSTLKIPVYQDIEFNVGTALDPKNIGNEAGMIGDIIFRKSTNEICYHTGETWICIDPTPTPPFENDHVFEISAESSSFFNLRYNTNAPYTQNPPAGFSGLNNTQNFLIGSDFCNSTAIPQPPSPLPPLVFESTRLYFICDPTLPTNGAFRAGTAENDEWDFNNVGQNSFAVNRNNIAAGTNTSCLGNSNNLDQDCISSSILGGTTNIILNSTNSSILSGDGDASDNLQNAQNTSIVSGFNNRIASSTLLNSIIGSGNNNQIEQTGTPNIRECGILCGINNRILNGTNNIILGGENNEMSNLIGFNSSIIFSGNNNTLNSSSNAFLGATSGIVVNNSDNIAIFSGNEVTLNQGVNNFFGTINIINLNTPQQNNNSVFVARNLTLDGSPFSRVQCAGINNTVSNDARVGNGMITGRDCFIGNRESILVGGVNMNVNGRFCSTFGILDVNNFPLNPNNCVLFGRNISGNGNCDRSVVLGGRDNVIQRDSLNYGFNNLSQVFTFKIGGWSNTTSRYSSYNAVNTQGNTPSNTEKTSFVLSGLNPENDISTNPITINTGFLQSHQINNGVGGIILTGMRNRILNGHINIICAGHNNIIIGNNSPALGNGCFIGNSMVFTKNSVGVLNISGPYPDDSIINLSVSNSFNSAILSGARNRMSNTEGSSILCGLLRDPDPTSPNVYLVNNDIAGGSSSSIVCGAQNEINGCNNSSILSGINQQLLSRDNIASAQNFRTTQIEEYAIRVEDTVTPYNLVDNPTYYLVLEHSVSGVAVNLPTLSVENGRVYIIKNITGGDADIIPTGGNLIQDLDSSTAPTTLPYVLSQNDSKKFVFDASADTWQVYNA